MKWDIKNMRTSGNIAGKVPKNYLFLVKKILLTDSYWGLFTP